MTRPSDADQVITGYAAIDGSGEGNWSEETVGRITRNKTWDQRYRTPAPSSHPDDVSLGEFVAALFVIGLCVTAAWLWTAILAVSNV